MKARSLFSPPAGLKQYYKLVQSHPLPHKVFEEKVQHLLELFGKIPFNQALVFSNLHTRSVSKVATRWGYFADTFLTLSPTLPGRSTWPTSSAPKVYRLLASQVEASPYLH